MTTDKRDDLDVIRALMGVTKSITIGQPSLGLVHAALHELVDLRTRVARLRSVAEERRQVVPGPNGDVSVGGLHVDEVLAILDGDEAVAS